MENFQDSSNLLDRPEALQARLAEDGYLFLGQVVDRERLLELRRDITNVLSQAGWLDTAADPMDAVPGIVPWVEGEEGYLHTYDDVQRLESFHRLPHHESVLGVMQKVLDDSAFPHPLAIARLVFPQNDAWSTPAHQDYPNNQGTANLLAAWIPLADCPRAAGGLAVLKGSHRHGLMPLEFAMGAGHRQALLSDVMQTLPWVSGDFNLGDMLIFHSHTVHRALHNSSTRMRLSVDYRFQKQGQALTEPCLKPHFGRLEWEEIYRGWCNQDIAWYWHSKRYEVVPWDASLHALSAADEAAAIRVSLRNERMRQRLRAAREDQGKGGPAGAN